MAKKNVSDVISGMGVGMSIIQSLVAKVQAKGGTDKNIHCLATPEGDRMLDAFAELLVKKQEDKNRTVFPVKIDCSKTIEEMIKVGKYDWVNENISSENFLISSEGVIELELELMHFNRSISSEDALAEMDKQGYRPASIEEIFATGETFPDADKEFPIIALGSSWVAPDCGRRVPCLIRSGFGRDLRLYLFDSGWHDGCRFLVVRK